MFLDRLINQGNGPLLERVLGFSAQRQKILAENVANASTPGYRQKDLSVKEFQAMLRDRVSIRDAAAPGSVGFEDIDGELEHPERGVMFHDRNNRSMESLMTDVAKNAMMHNLAVELMRKAYGQMDMALKERIG
jgi:flagellar basal-body rod protein FlgB